MCCVLPALVALYKGYLLNIVYQVNCGGPIVKGKSLLRWKVFPFNSIVDVLKWLHLVLKELDMRHPKIEYHVLYSATS